MKRILTLLLSALALVVPAGGSAVSAAAADRYNVKDYGATGDGTTLDTEAINRTIEAAAAAGGGTVWFPAGTYASHSIRLKSNISLYIDQGATIRAAEPTEAAGYDVAEPNPWDRHQDFGHSHWQNSLIWGIDLHDISILGPGLIDGTDVLSRGEPRPGSAIRPANKAIALKLCRNVTIRDVSILMGGHFAIITTGVDNLTIDNVKVDTNRDGFDIDACRNVRISNCSVNALQDDAIVLKSSYALGIPRACENITITNCSVTGFDPGTFLDGTFGRDQALAPDREGPTGRIKFGTESNIGFIGITISNCVFERSRGIALETVDGARIEDILIDNVVLRGVSNSAIFLRVGGRMRAPEGTPASTMRRVTLSNITATDVDPRYSTLITGLPGRCIEDLTLTNIRIQYRGGLSLDHAARQPAELINTFFQRNSPEVLGPREDPYAVPENETTYPEPCTFGILPAYGMYIRHVKNLVLDGVELGFEAEDTRPVFVLDDVSGAEFRNLKVDRAEGAPFFVLRGVTDFSTFNVRGLENTTRARAADEIL